MAQTFPLQIVSMDGLQFDGEAQRIVLRAATGDVAILARHIDYCSPIGMGTAKVVLADGTEKKAACIGGMLSVLGGTCRVMPITWEWADAIDSERAERAMEVAKKRLEEAREAQNREAQVRAEAKLYRSLVRLQTTSK